MTQQATTAAEGRPFKRRVKYPRGTAVRVADTRDRYHDTHGKVTEHVQALGTTIYRVAAERVCEHGHEHVRENWACLFFPGQLRRVEPSS